MSGRRRCGVAPGALVAPAISASATAPTASGATVRRKGDLRLGTDGFVLADGTVRTCAGYLLSAMAPRTCGGPERGWCPGTVGRGPSTSGRRRCSMAVAEVPKVKVEKIGLSPFGEFDAANQTWPRGDRPAAIR